MEWGAGCVGRVFVVILAVNHGLSVRLFVGNRVVLAVALRLCARAVAPLDGYLN